MFRQLDHLNWMQRWHYSFYILYIDVMNIFWLLSFAWLPFLNLSYGFRIFHLLASMPFGVDRRYIINHSSCSVLLCWPFHIVTLEKCSPGLRADYRRPMIRFRCPALLGHKSLVSQRIWSALIIAVRSCTRMGRWSSNGLLACIQDILST